MRIRATIGATTAAVAIGVFWLSGAARAQEAPKGALSDIARRLASQSSAALENAGKAGKGSAATRFKPSGKRILLESLVTALGQDPNRRDALRQLFTQGMANYEEALRKEGRANDVSAAFTLFIATHWGIATGKPVSDAASDRLLAQVDALFDTPEMKNTADVDKQRFYEYCSYLTIFTAAMQEATTDEAAKKQVRGAAAQVFKTLLSVDPAKVNITAERGLVLAESPTSGEVGTTSAALSSVNLSAQAPAGWEKRVEQGGVTYTRSVKTDKGVLEANVLILSAAARKGSPETLANQFFDDLVRSRLPAPGLASDLRPEVFRCYIGNGLRAAFTTVSRKVKQDSLDYLGTEQMIGVYAVESGDLVVPIMIVLSGHDGMGTDGKYINPNVRHEWLDQLLETFTGTPTHKPLFSRAELVGAYKMSSSALGPQYYNIHTGASAGYGFVSRGSDITLNADGTCEVHYAGASGIGMVSTMYSEKGKGSFQIVKTGSADILIMKDSKSGREFKERLAGAFTLPGSAGKVMITLPLNMPITPLNVGQSADRYLTKPPTK